MHSRRTDPSLRKPAGRHDGAGNASGDQPPAVPELSESEAQEAEQRTALRAHVVHEAVRQEGEEELARPGRALAWSGLAAGLSMGFSLVSEGLLRAHLPHASWRSLVVALGYPVGYLIVILGRQQLFTENTLTVILPLLARRDITTLMNVIRLWAIVLLANVVGVVAIAAFLSHVGVLSPDVRAACGEIGREAAQGDFWTVAGRGLMAGWLIALVVWMLPAAEGARVAVIVIITYVVGLGGFSHIVAGSVEVTYATMTGGPSWREMLAGYMCPTLLGNVVGGVSLVALVNHAQVIAGSNR